MKGNEGKNSGDYFIIECKMPLDIFGRFFFDSSGVGAGGLVI